MDSDFVEKLEKIHEESDVLPKLFSMGLEEIIQKIFLYLDPKR